MDYLLHVIFIIVLRSRYWYSIFEAVYWRTLNRNPFLFSWIYSVNFKVFTVLFFNIVRFSNYSSLPYIPFNVDPNYIIWRYSLFFFLQNTAITIFTIFVQVIKRHFFFYIKSFYWRVCHLSNHRFISIQLSVFNKLNSHIINYFITQLGLCNFSNICFFALIIPYHVSITVWSYSYICASSAEPELIFS